MVNRIERLSEVQLHNFARESAVEAGAKRIGDRCKSRLTTSARTKTILMWAEEVRLFEVGQKVFIDYSFHCLHTIEVVENGQQEVISDLGALCPFCRGVTDTTFQ